MGRAAFSAALRAGLIGPVCSDVRLQLNGNE